MRNAISVLCPTCACNQAALLTRATLLLLCFANFALTGLAQFPQSTTRLGMGAAVSTDGNVVGVGFGPSVGRFLLPYLELGVGLGIAPGSSGATSIGATLTAYPESGGVILPISVGAGMVAATNDANLGSGTFFGLGFGVLIPVGGRAWLTPSVAFNRSRVSVREQVYVSDDRGRVSASALGIGLSLDFFLTPKAAAAPPRTE